MIAVDPKYNPNLMSELEPKTLLGPGVSISKFLVGARHGVNTWSDLNFLTRQGIARNLVPQIELIRSINGPSNDFSGNRLAVSEGVYFAGEGETVGGLNATKQTGQTVVYELYGRDGTIDLSAGYGMALLWRDFFDYDELAVSYDTLNPDGSLHMNVIVTMPSVPSDYDVRFKNQVATYFNNTKVSSSELIEISV